MYKNVRITWNQYERLCEIRENNEVSTAMMYIIDKLISLYEEGSKEYELHYGYIDSGYVFFNKISFSKEEIIFLNFLVNNTDNLDELLFHN